MSTYGGDSWVPEAQLRLKRVKMLLQEKIPEDEVTQLRNGKYICLVCSNTTTMFESLQILTIHRRGKKHQQQYLSFLRAKNNTQQRKQRLQLEKPSSTGPNQQLLKTTETTETTETTTTTKTTTSTSTCKDPLILLTQKITYNALFDEKKQQQTLSGSFQQQFDAGPSKKRRVCDYQGQSYPQLHHTQEQEQHQHQHQHQQQRSYQNVESKFPGEHAAELSVCLDSLHQRGWRRDAFGQFYKDSSVEFDSDEEFPPIPEHLLPYFNGNEAKNQPKSPNI